MLGFSIFWINSMFNKITMISFALLSVMFMSGCSSTKMRDVWQDEKFARDDIKDMLVVGFTANITNRMVFEREFVYQLEKRGVQASTSELGAADIMVSSGDCANTACMVGERSSSFSGK